MEGYGQIIRTLRLEAGLTQRQLAARLQSTDGYVAFVELERRLPSPEFVGRLMEALQPNTAERERLLTALEEARRRHIERREEAQKQALRESVRAKPPEPLAASASPSASVGDDDWQQAAEYLRLAWRNGATRDTLLGVLQTFASQAQATLPPETDT